MYGGGRFLMYYMLRAAERDRYYRHRAKQRAKRMRRAAHQRARARQQPRVVYQYPQYAPPPPQAMTAYYPPMQQMPLPPRPPAGPSTAQVLGHAFFRGAGHAMQQWSQMPNAPIWTQMFAPPPPPPPQVIYRDVPQQPPAYQPPSTPSPAAAASTTVNAAPTNVTPAPAAPAQPSQPAVPDYSAEAASALQNLGYPLAHAKTFARTFHATPGETLIAYLQRMLAAIGANK